VPENNIQYKDKRLAQGALELEGSEIKFKITDKHEISDINILLFLQIFLTNQCIQILLLIFNLAFVFYSPKIVWKFMVLLQKQ
jgi:hypothetical protein